jgi:RES domain-containing protein
MYYSTAMLEKLVRGSGRLPPNQHYIKITIPNASSYELLNPAHLPGWDDGAALISKAYGEAWHTERRSLIMIVPSVVARVDSNILINPSHPEFAHITYTLHQPVWWDARLFGG